MTKEFIKEKIKREGYVVIPDFLEAPAYYQIQFSSLFRIQCRINGCRDIFELFKKHPEVVKNCGKLMQGLPELYELASSKALLDTVKKVLPIPSIVTRPLVHFHNKRLAEREINYRTPAHQDQASVMGSLNGLIAWIPLVDCLTPEIGPLEVVPRSHLMGAQWSEFDGSFGLVKSYDDSDFKPLYMKAGDLLLFSSSLVHRSGNNITEDKIRWSMTLRYSDISAIDWQNRGFHSPYIYKPVMDAHYTVTPEEMENAFDNSDPRFVTI